MATSIRFQLVKLEIAVFPAKSDRWDKSNPNDDIDGGICSVGPTHFRGCIKDKGGATWKRIRVVLI